ncbi:MAG: ABC transporter substrate-binding protein [Thermomicrobiales bacterium]
MGIARLSRRRLLRGAAGAAAGASVIGFGKRGSVFAAPAVIQEGGSTVKVVYWSAFAGNLGDAEQELVDRFNDSRQDVEVERQFQGAYGETAQKMTDALMANQAPDAVVLDTNWLRFYANQTLAPLDDLMAANGIDTSDFVEPLYVEGVREGKAYWLSFARSTPLLYDNKVAFAEAGLSAPPATWSELREVAPQLVGETADGTPRSALAYAPYLAWLLNGQLWAFGGAYSDPDFTIRIADEGSITAGECFRSAIIDGWATVPRDGHLDFINGLTSSLIATTGQLANVKQNAQFDFGVAFLPSEVQPGCPTGGAGMSILAAAPPERQEAAFKFLAYATGVEGTTFWSQNIGYMPVRTSAIASPEMQAYFAENPNYKIAVDQLPQTRQVDTAYSFPNGPAIIDDGLQRVAINHEEVPTVFPDVAQKLEEDGADMVEQLAA